MRGRGRGLLAHPRWLVVFLIMSLGLLGLPSVASAAGTTAVSVSAPTQPIGSGEQFTVSIVVVPNTAIAGMQFDLSFDASFAAVSKVEEGGLLKQGGASTFFNSGSIDNQAGRITGVFGAITGPGKTVSMQGTFATVTLTAKTQSGSCHLSLSNVVVGDMNGNPVSVSVVGGTASIDRPPVLAAIGSKTVNEGATLTFTISATDPDGDVLAYSASNLPLGASFDSATRTFSWTPAYNQGGVYASIHFQVGDGSLTDSEDITITVSNITKPDVNDDGAISVLDMIRVGQHWNQTGPGGWIREDINEDGIVSVIDATIIGQHWTG